jgi:hypothetical protein
MSDEQNTPQREVWSDEDWQLYVAKLPPILRPKDFGQIPSWMLYKQSTFPKRFDTHFFVAAMPEDQTATHDEGETVESVWIRPEEALSRYEHGDFPLVFATIHQLVALRELDSMTAVRNRFAGGPLPTVRPQVIEYAGADVIVITDPENEG